MWSPVVLFGPQLKEHPLRLKFVPWGPFLSQIHCGAMGLGLFNTPYFLLSCAQCTKFVVVLPLSVVVFLRCLFLTRKSGH